MSEIQQVQEQEIHMEVNDDGTSLPVDSGQILQLNLRGDALSKFASILQEKGFQTAEEAMDYFYSLHVQQAPKKPPGKRGRPKGSRNKRPRLAERVLDIDNVADDAHSMAPAEVAASSPGDGDSVTTTEGADAPVVVPGVLPLSIADDDAGSGNRRRSARQRRNPFVGTDYVAPPKLGESSDEAEDVGADQAVDGGSFSTADGLASVVRSHVGDADDELWTPAQGRSVENDNGEDIAEELTADSDDDVEGDDAYSRFVPFRARGRRRARRGRPRKRPFTQEELSAEEKASGKCSDCSEAFSDVAQLLAHKLEHVGKNGKPFECGSCDYTASFKCDIERHRRKHQMEKTHKCSVCEFSTNWERNLFIHMNKVHEGKHPWKCDKCGELVHNHSKIKQHQLSHRENAFRCDLCGLLFDKEKQLQLHANIHTNSRPHTCRVCGYATTYRSNLLNHVRFKHQNVKRGNLPKKNHRCRECNKMFKTEEHLQIHCQAHDVENKNDEKPFYCSECTFRAADVNQIVRHRLVHRLDKPFSCSLCDYSTRWRKDLRTHEMIHTGAKTVRCPQCDYSCYTMQRLKVHMLRHDTTKRFPCDLCGTCFKTRQVLRLHRLYHTGESLFECTECGFKTITETRLRKHRLKHTDERNYACELCGKRFKQPHHVSQHRDIVHLGKPSYREKRRIALQQSTVEVLGGLAAGAGSGEMCYNTSVLVNNEDGTLTFSEAHDPEESTAAAVAVHEENTHYVMVETPQGYQYVAVVLPDNGCGDDGQQQHQQATILDESIGNDGSTEVDTAGVQQESFLDDGQSLLQGGSSGEAAGLVYCTDEEAADGAGETTLIALQP